MYLFELGAMRPKCMDMLRWMGMWDGGAKAWANLIGLICQVHALCCRETMRR